MKRALPCLLLLLLLVRPARAAFVPDAVRDALPEEARELGGTLTLDGSYDSAGALERLWRHGLDALRSAGKNEAKTALCLLSLVLLASLASAAAPGKQQADMIELAAAAAAALLLAEGLGSLVSDCEQTLYRLGDYAKAALPAVFTAAAMTGAMASSAAKYAAVSLALDTMMNAQQALLLPLCKAALALGVAQGLFPDALLRSVTSLLQKGATLLMSLMSIALVSFIGVTGLVSGAADATAVKTAKTLVSAALPVVGGILSDAAGAALSAAGMILSAAGAFALVGVTALCLGPLLRLLLRYAVFQLAAGAAQSLAGERLSGLLKNLGSAVALLLGLVGSFTLMLFFSLIAAMRVLSG